MRERRLSVGQDKLSELQEVDLVIFSFSSYFLFLFFKLFFFSLFLVPRVRVSDNMGHMVQRRFQKDDIIPHADLMANIQLFRVSQKQLAYTMRIQYIKVEYSVQSSLSSFLVSSNKDYLINLTLRVLSYNINMVRRQNVTNRICDLSHLKSYQ